MPAGSKSESLLRMSALWGLKDFCHDSQPNLLKDLPLKNAIFLRINAFGYPWPAAAELMVFLIIEIRNVYYTSKSF